MADFLDEKLKEIEGRMRELRPAAEEYAQLEKAAKVLSAPELRASDPGGTYARGEVEESYRQRPAKGQRKAYRRRTAGKS